jgi:hypothetical protein
VSRGGSAAARGAAESGKAAAKKAPARKAPARKAPAQKSAASRQSPTTKAGPATEPPAAVAPTPGPQSSSSATPSAPHMAPALPAGAAPRRSGWFVLAGPSSPALVYAGVVAVVAGFALLFLAWSEVAAQSDVWRQMPFVISAGFPGLGLIMTGLVMASVGVRRQEGLRRQRQMAALTEALRSVEDRAG